nr:MAG TPA: hypothetical protein [Caudoviricetes sp.]
MQAPPAKQAGLFVICHWGVGRGDPTPPECFAAAANFCDGGELPAGL